MKKTIRIIDLFIKIANGEEVPRKFTYKGYLWEYDVKNEMWFYYFGNGKNHRFDRLFYLHKCLNDEIKIIEDEEDKKIEKLNEKQVTKDAFEKCNGSNLYSLSLVVTGRILNKINEIIDAINELKKGE